MLIWLLLFSQVVCAAQLRPTLHPSDIIKTVDIHTAAQAIEMCRMLPKLARQLEIKQKRWKTPIFTDAELLADSISSAFPDQTQDIELLRVATFIVANIPKKRLLSLALFLTWHALEPDRDAVEERISFVRKKFCRDTPK